MVCDSQLSIGWESTDEERRPILRQTAAALWRIGSAEDFELLNWCIGCASHGGAMDRSVVFRALDFANARVVLCVVSPLSDSVDLVGTFRCRREGVVSA